MEKIWFIFAHIPPLTLLGLIKDPTHVFDCAGLTSRLVIVAKSTNYAKADDDRPEDKVGVARIGPIVRDLDSFINQSQFMQIL